MVSDFRSYANLDLTVNSRLVVLEETSAEVKRRVEL